MNDDDMITIAERVVGKLDGISQAEQSNRLFVPIKRERSIFMNNKVFCDECRKDVKVITKEVLFKRTLKDNEYTFTGFEAYCGECGSPIYVPEIEDNNLKLLYDAYRKENDIIPLDEILAIPKKYAIGKRPLSLLLGWGEQTFTRYCNGDMPSKQYSDILRRLYNEPLYYNELLQNNKDRMKSNSSYEKSNIAVKNLIGIPAENYGNWW